jgi:hypothetical protein
MAEHTKLTRDPSKGGCPETQKLSKAAQQMNWQHLMLWNAITYAVAHVPFELGVPKILKYLVQYFGPMYARLDSSMMNHWIDWEKSESVGALIWKDNVLVRAQRGVLRSGRSTNKPILVRILHACLGPRPCLILWQ